jgi:hypothetical protein
MNSTDAAGAATIIAAFIDLRFFQEGLIGAGFGSLFGRFMIHRAERDGGELRPRRIRQLNLRWTCVGLSFAVLRALLSRLP